MIRSSLLRCEYPPATYVKDMGKRTCGPPNYDYKRSVPGTQQALRRVWASRINGSNRWLCCLHLLSAN